MATPYITPEGITLPVKREDDHSGNPVEETTGRSGRLGEFSNPIHMSFGAVAECLSPRHYAEIVERSGVAPELVEGRYRTVTAEEARALGFSKNQARPGWVVELISPSGEVSYQLKPNLPREKIKNGKAKPIKYETPARRDNIISVHPRMRCRVMEGKEDIWVVEGAKKGDCLVSRDRPTVVLTGVWNWGKKRERNGVKYGRPELLPDWNAIPLEGRKVYIAYDIDLREKREIALALKGLAETLTERGAHVYIVWLPGPQKGVDDYVVDGGDLERLEKNATPYQACDLTPYIAKDSRLIRRVVAANERRMAEDDWSYRGSKTDHSLMRAFLELVLEHGTEGMEEGVEMVDVVAPQRELQDRGAIGSRTTITKSIGRLEGRGYLRKLPSEDKREPNRYRILNPTAVNHIDRGTEEDPLCLHQHGSLLSGYAPHLRWPAPPPPEDTPVGYTGSRLPHLGKTREMILHLLTSWGGQSTMGDLARATGVNDTTHLRNRYLQEFDELGIVELPEKGTRGAKAMVRLTPEWRQRLDARRELGGELAAARRRVVRSWWERSSFHSSHQADREPPIMNRERARRLIAERGKDDERARIEEQRRKVGVTAEVFVHDRLTHQERIRIELLKEVWQEEGGDPRHIWPAIRRLGCKVLRLPEWENGLFVFSPNDER